jgi:hypothetical protein
MLIEYDENMQYLYDDAGRHVASAPLVGMWCENDWLFFAKPRCRIKASTEPWNYRLTDHQPTYEMEIKT